MESSSVKKQVALDFWFPPHLKKKFAERQVQMSQVPVPGTVLLPNQPNT